MPGLRKSNLPQRNAPVTFGSNITFTALSLGRGLLILQPKARDRSTSRFWPITTGGWKYGRRIARRISKTAPRWWARKSPGSKAATATPCTSTNRRSAQHTPTALCTTRPLPTNWRRSTIWRVVLKRLDTPISAKRGTVTTAGRRRQSAATRSILSAFGRIGRTPSCLNQRHDRHAGRAAGRRDYSQGFPSALERDCPPQADREAHANRGGACKSGARTPHPAPRERTAHRGRGYYRPGQSRCRCSTNRYYRIRSSQVRAIVDNPIRAINSFVYTAISYDAVKRNFDR